MALLKKYFDAFFTYFFSILLSDKFYWGFKTGYLYICIVCLYWLLAFLNTYDHYNESTSKLKSLYLNIFHEALVLNF
jgi:hypothetical protein